MRKMQFAHLDMKTARLATLIIGYAAATAWWGRTGSMTNVIVLVFYLPDQQVFQLHPVLRLRKWVSRRIPQEDHRGQSSPRWRPHREQGQQRRKRRP
jgi:hypothetical protein